MGYEMSLILEPGEVLVTDSLLKVRELEVSFKTDAGLTKVLDKVDFDILPAEIKGLVGESGCGKTTLARSVLGILPKNSAVISSGTILFEDTDLLKVPEKSLANSFRGRTVTFIPQDPFSSFNPFFTIGSQMMELMKWKSPERPAQDTSSRYEASRKKNDRKRIIELLKQVQLPDAEGIMKRYPHEVSGGQRQRLMIAMALLPEPQMIIADEPTTALDVTIQAQILKLIRNLTVERGVSVIFTTHDLGVAYEICDQISVMLDGKIVENSDSNKFFTNPRHSYTKKLLNSLPMGQASALKKSKDDDGPILQINNLSKWFSIDNVWNKRIGWLKAIDDVSLEVRKGEILGIVGESGCGKSTLGKTVMGIHPLTAGQITFEGSEIGHLKPSEARQLRRRLQYTYQDPGSSLDPRWKIGRSLLEPLDIHTELSLAEKQQRVEEILAAVNLPKTHLDLYPHEISGGQQRRVGLARILTLHPSLVILDEPTSGLDVSVQATILKLFSDLREKFDLTYIFISHDLSVVKMFCNRVAVMYFGKVVEVNETKKLFEKPQHPYTKNLLSSIPNIGGKRVIETFTPMGAPPDQVEYLNKGNNA